MPRSRAPPTGLDDRPPRAEPRSKEMVAAKHTCGGDPDIVLLSFFDGLGTACLICDEYCKGQGLRWKGASCEIDGNLVKLIAQHFPDVVARGDFEKESATSLRDLVQTLDPGGKATVVVAAGPPCHDFSRIRSDAPGHDGPEGSRFSRFAQLVVDLEKRWQHGRAVLLVRTSSLRTEPTCARSRRCSMPPPSFTTRPTSGPYQGQGCGGAEFRGKKSRTAQSVL